MVYVVSEIDERIAALSPRSLSPERTTPTPLVHLFEAYELDETQRQSILRIAASHLKHFPETIFWDYDHLVAFIGQTDRPPEEVADDFVGLFEKFGRHSKIAFRYVHDFFLGFDWVKWIGKSDGTPEHHPFSKDAIAYLFRRGDEIEVLISKNDEEYPQLEDGVPRNAYRFSREPADEQRILETLAERALVPLEMWNAEAVPKCDRPYLLERERVADEIGLRRR